MTVQALLWAPASSPEGGHRVQLTKTMEALNAGGRVCARVSLNRSESFDSCDVVHGFGLSPGDARRVRESGKGLVLSPIYCSKRYRQRGLLPLPRGQEVWWRARSTVGMALAGLRGEALEKAELASAWVIETRALYELADLLLPNSKLEERTLKQDLGVTTHCHVIPNAVDPVLFPFRTEGSRNGVLMVGRVEPHKNQLRLIKACKSLGVPLTVVGDPHPDHHRYFRECQRHEGRLVRVLPHRAHAELGKLYRQARVHALPSYFETTGLVSLEAALSGCAIVTTGRGYARDYFADLAQYCEPHDLDSITDALSRAITRSSDRNAAERLRRRILDRYTWEHAAAATADAYESVMR